MSYRQTVIERDFSGFVSSTISETGGMVVVSARGRGDKPILNQSENDVLMNFGNPSATYPSVFEAVAFSRKAPCYIVSAIGDSALYGRVDVRAASVSGVAVGVSSVTTVTFSSNDIGFSIFPTSQWASTWEVSVEAITGTQFKLTLYDLVSGNDIYLADYTFSLTREKDGFGKSLYYDDVFNEDPYLIIYPNPTTTVVTYTVDGTDIQQITGGTRGSTPSTAQITTAWNLFQSANKYPCMILMDALGDHAGDVNTLIQTYQLYAHGIACMPLGKTVATALTYRSALSLDTDNVSIYYNWVKVKDPYNASLAWINCVGSVGKKYAYMSDVYDSLAPAGVDENGHGGQLSDWTPVEVEKDLSEANLQSLDEAQINPIIFDEVYGLMIYGDKTLQVSNSDSSYVGTRRLYNLILKTVSKQILRKQEFKNNDSFHRLKAKSMTDDFLSPILAGAYLREAAVVCDESNNTDVVLEQRKFLLDIYVKCMPTSEFTILRLTRVSQTMVLAEMITP
jgi:hypothetical protein